MAGAAKSPGLSVLTNTNIIARLFVLVNTLIPLAPRIGLCYHRGMTIYYRLKELLAQRHMSLRALQRETDIALSTLSAIYRDQTTRIDKGTLDKICEALDCAPGDLIIRVESTPPTSPIP